MWTGSSGAHRTTAPSKATGRAPGSVWNNQESEPSGYMWEKEDISHQNARPISNSMNANVTMNANRSQYNSAQRGQDSDQSANGIPDPPKSFPELESMTLADLMSLNSDRARFDDFVSKHRYQREIEATIVRLRRSVEACEQEQKVVSSKAHEVVDEEGLIKLRQQISEIENDVGELRKKKQEWLEQNSPEKLMERLRIAMRESESKSEELENRMLSSSMNFDDFLSQYIVCRQKYHERCLKLEQLQKEVRKKSFGR